MLPECGQELARFSQLGSRGPVFWVARVMAGQQLYEVGYAIPVTVLIGNDLKALGNRGLLAGLAQLLADGGEAGAKWIVRFLLGEGIGGLPWLLRHVAGSAIVQVLGQKGAEIIGQGPFVRRPSLSADRADQETQQKTNNRP